MPKHLRYAALVAIFLLATAGRILNIDNESLWVDEGFSYWALRQPDVPAMWQVIQRDVHPPVYFFLLRGWSAFTGLSELALRYFSVLPSLLSVAVVYQIARELLKLSDRLRSTDSRGDAIIPLLAALMMALADMENYIAQETRSYTWHVLWAALSMWAFLRWVNTGRRGYLVDWAAVSILLLYTHYIGICTLVVQGLFALAFLRRRKLLETLAGFMVVGAVWLPWVLVIISGQTANIGTGFNVPSTLESLWNWRDQWFTQQWPLMMGLALLGVAGLSVQRSGRKDMMRPVPTGLHLRAVFLPLLWFVVPIALTYILNWYTPILMDYRLTQITPAVALLIGFGLGQFRGAALAFLVSVIVVYGVVVDDTHIDREPWREIGQFAAQYAEPGDLALAHVTPSGDWQMVYYFDRLLPAGTEVRSLRQWQLEQGETYAAGLPALLEQHPHVWLMHWSSDRSGFEALAQTGHVPTARVSWDWVENSQLDLYRFDQLPSEEEAVARWENGMVLRDAEIDSDELGVDLWWSFRGQSLDADYTISARLLDANGQLVAQIDSYPFEGRRPTSGWQPGEAIYDPRTLQPAPGIDALPPGDYMVGVKIYRLNPDNTFTDILTTKGEAEAIIGTLQR
ncbi:MAG: glycosyltransferase family 39 protein [bacterium]|nr:glycosyltransferase family 39 protein [bacterium]